MDLAFCPCLTFTGEEGDFAQRMRTLRIEKQVFLWYDHRMRLEDVVSGIAPLNENAMEEARDHLDSLAKPTGSLGELERYAVKLAGITGKLPPDISRRAVLVFCADNGVCAEGIGSAPQSVTRSQTINFVRGLTGVATLARAFRATVIAADVGVNVPIEYPGVRNLRVRASTGNIRVEDAMTREEATAAVLSGAMLAQEMAVRGYGLLGVGEMGIGNTTTSTAVLSAMTGVETDVLCGIGGGIGGSRLEKKRQVLREAVARINPDPQDPIGILAALGGLDICAMAGAYLGAAAARLPVVLDGLIGCVAGLVAVQIAPQAQPYLFPSHVSEEPGAKLALEKLGLAAPLHLHLRLGEGSGCPLMFSLLDAACAVYRDMGTFEEATIDPGYLEDIKR